MSTGARAAGDRARWNERYRMRTPSFASHPLLGLARAAGTPDGPMLELACGPSGSALEALAEGRAVTAVDVSDVALHLLTEEAHRRGLTARLTCVRADAAAWASEEAPRRGYALVLATLFWDAAACTAATRLVAPGGLLGWEALRRPADAAPHPYRVPHGTVASFLPEGYVLLDEHASETTTRVLARAPA